MKTLHQGSSNECVRESQKKQKSIGSPDFLIIGAQKGGTTSLYNYILQHPLVAPALVEKEIHFFDLNFDKGMDWYLAQFPATPQPDVILRGEATPYYLFHPLVPKRVSQLCPNVKLIVLLRNPVDRAVSHYFWEVGLGIEKLSLREAIDHEPQRLQGELEKMLSDQSYYSFNHQHYSYLSRGIYVEQINRWLDYFAPEQILILRSEDLFVRPDEILSQVFRFLGLPDCKLAEHKRYNPGSYFQGDQSIHCRLREYFRGHNQRLAAATGRNFDWE